MNKKIISKITFIEELDAEAMKVANVYRQSEAKLLKVIIQIENCKLCYKLGYNSLFAYVTERLKLSPAVTYNLIGVARKSKEVPELKEQVLSGKISVSKARKLTSVINKDNQEAWIESALSKSSRALEREIALASPKQAVQERVQYIPADQEKHESVKIKQQVSRVQLQLGVSEKIMFKLRRAQDLECQKKKQNQGLEETLEALLDVYLEKRDPLKKAIRQKNRGKLTVNHESSKAKKNELNSEKEIGLKTLNKNIDLNNLCLKKSVKRLDEETEKGCLTENNLESGLVTDKLKRNIPAQTIHQLQLRDRGQCTYHNNLGERCQSRRYLEIHHIKSYGQGGNHNLDNLTLLCSGHHKAQHLSFVK